MQFGPLLTAHEKKKKELLVLPYDQLTFLVALALNKYTGDSWEIHDVLRRAAQRAPGIGEWTQPKAERAKSALLKTPFVYATYRGLTVIAGWRETIIFAADALRPEYLKAIVQSVGVGQQFKALGNTGRYFAVRYDEIRQRCIHHILLNRAEEFDELYQQLQQESSYNPTGQHAAQESVDAILATADWNFWKTRSTYFQLSALTEQQYAYRKWSLRSPEELERMVAAMGTGLPEGEYLEEIRIITLLGLHHYRNKPDFFPAIDPGLVALCHLVNGEAGAASQAFSQLPRHDPEQVAGIIHIIHYAFAYGRGDWDLERLSREVGRLQLSDFPKPVNCFIAYVKQEDGEVETGEELLMEQFVQGFDHPFEWLVALWCAAWMGIKVRSKYVAPLFHALEEGDYAQLPWLEGEIVYVAKRLFPRKEVTLGDRDLPALAELEDAAFQEENSLLHLLPEKPSWNFALRQLRQIKPSDDGTIFGMPEYRTIWIVDFAKREAYCKEQKGGFRGWSKGRRLKLTELVAPKRPAAMDPADERALAAIRTNNGRTLSSNLHYSDDALRVDFGRLLYEIADHPRIYLGEKRRLPLELVRAEPELRISEGADGKITLRFFPDVEKEGYVWSKVTPTRYQVFHLTAEQARMAWALSDGVEVPPEQRPLLQDMVESLRPQVNVQSAFDLIDENLETLQGSPLPCFHLLPFGEGYKIELYVKPLPEEPFYFKPGDGMARSIVLLDSGRYILERNLQLESQEAAAAIAACPTLAALPLTAYEWTVEDTHTALRILLELRRLLAEQLLTIEHPKGEKLRIVGQAGSDELALRVGRERDWFEVNGKLTVNEDKVLDLEVLLAHVRHDDTPFIELGEGAFVALTEELRDRILEMEGLLHRKGNKLQLPQLAAGAFAEVADDLEDLEYDAAWQESLDRIARAEKIRPRVPKGFRAELRDYQKDGFRWLMRLAAWGVGGCLADDMGLGKTVQALGMLTARADLGPSLVIAPASVTRNWLRETERFAPGLVPILIASGQDTALLAELGTGDLALVSYGLLPFIGEELAEVRFANIILDEAQAIKNAATKRAKIVQQLQGDFKLATTGTPIENHLGELWSLFRFLNPGLLRSKAAFNEKYNKPITRNGDEERRNALKQLVKPFILRRRKDQVLTELPPKTEMVLNVQLSEEEKALYEALRRQALREIAAADEQQKRFTVLAQLTKLRQAACHPRLVRPASKLSSAKLELVGETLLEILESGHKALIFSQFVKHLKIVENWIKGQGIAYQYLDGSTPGKKREAAVRAFQAGEGEVFLISLKAGGTGLNLTAADYVLHLDPWWNPAAEDQASDRAHRIGQQRPVTVYRFVSEGTIEEQIIALHAEKRDLADQILSGTGKAGALGVDEILSLIRQS